MGASKDGFLDIISGLTEVDDIVHRDLKPGNVLWHEGRWKVADFGIAKFVEDSTSLETLRNSLTPAYGAPEQWLGEAPTRATDVYALGCIIHTMINGKPPFGGDVDKIRKAHLNEEPPELDNVDVRLRGLVRFMLRKSAPSRPSLERCAKVIQSVDGTVRRSGLQALADAGHAVAKEEAAAEAKRRAIDTAVRERNALAAEAIGQFKQLMDRLFEEIAASSEATKRQSRAIIMGPAHLVFDEPQIFNVGQPQVSPPFENGWDIAAFSKLSLGASLERISMSDPSVYTFSATIVFARNRLDSNFRWRELSFFNWSGNSPMHSSPFSLNPGSREFQLALSNVVSGWQLAYDPFSIDAEDEDSFRERWISLFAKAAQRKLRPPSQLPLAPTFFA